MYNIFISHSWTYANQYNGLVSLLDRAPYFIYRNYSVPQNDPIHNAASDSALREAIRKQMAPCSCILVLAGVYSNYSKWINKEIELAQSGFITRKPIIAVEYWGSEHTSMVVKNTADAVVKWQTTSIVDAIRRLS